VPGDDPSATDPTRTLDPSAARSNDPEPPVSPGDRIGHFRIVSRLGSGGAGTVYAAVDADIPGRRVALKLIRPGGITPDVEALRREASALAALQHPNILVVHEIGDSPHGPYLVTELLSRGSLSDRLRDGVLPLADGLRLGRAVADALRAAHGRGLLHRDIKPPNVLMSQDGSAKVADFGLAFRTADTTSGDGSCRGRVRPAGTPPYVAPEVTEGALPTPAADQYAFGVTFHEILTGERPFPADRPRSGVPAGRIAVSRRLPRDVQAIVRRCLALEPGVRHRDMDHVVGAIDRAIERRHPRRRLVRLLAGALVLLAAGAAEIAAARWRAERRAHALNESGRAALERGDRDAARRAFLAAQSVDPGYEPACANLGALAAADSNPAWSVSILEECARTFPDSATARYNLGMILHATGRTDGAERELRRALALPGDGALRPLVVNELALVLLDAGRPAEAASVIEGWWDLPAAGTIDGALLRRSLGLARLAGGRAQDAVTALRTALAGPLPVARRASALAALGRALETVGDADGAVVAYSQALLAGPDAATVDAARQGLGRLQGGARPVPHDLARPRRRR
jgi:Flp pilus assembly protein TadD